MKKIRVGLSFVLLLVFSAICGTFYFLLNYFIAIALHELGHLLVAVNKGYKLKQIKLDIFGISVDLKENVEDKDMFAINIVGPLVNLLLCLMCLACYWLVPSCYEVLNTFCTSNLVLAIFNLIPVYPLDGGKILKSMVKNTKITQKCNLILKFLFAGLFLALFFINLQYGYNLFYLLIGVFFLTIKGEGDPTFSIFKESKLKRIQKITLLKVDEECLLFELIKLIKKSQYTIFYCDGFKQKYITEDDVVKIALNNSLQTKLCDIIL